MAKAAAKTGPGPTALVAVEQYYPKRERLIEDDAAFSILPPAYRAFVALTRAAFVRDWLVRSSEKDAPGIWGAMACRKRYIDEKLTQSLGKTDAVVNLGAGFDTRAFRLPLGDTPVWEVDLPQNIRAKRKGIERLRGRVPKNFHLAEMDFDRGDLTRTLAQHGYSADMRTFFIWEAVSQYLTRAGVEKTFSFFQNAAPQSRLAMTYVRRDFLEGRRLYGWERGYREYVKKGLWLFGLDPGEWPDFLKTCGWRVLEDAGYDELAARFIAPSGRRLAATAVERVLFAEKAFAPEK
jgi:methyltransferase (TIGR00027 family)